MPDVTPMERHHSLYALAPLVLANHRHQRYHGGDICLPLSTFAKEDQERLRLLYQYLGTFLENLSAQPGAVSPAHLENFLRAQPPDQAARLATQVGKASYALHPSPLMAKTIHDLRGGGLTPLLGQLQLAPRHSLEPAMLRSLFFLTRDHLKIMRNTVTGLDDVRREEDFRLRVHGTELIVEKWHGAVLYHEKRALRVEVDCPEATAISECCVEFGSVDRILYNLINNACRHAASDQLRLVILRVPDTSGGNLRFVLLNAVTEKDLAYLRPLDLATLFAHGTSTTGSGCGLAIATEFVSHAYGLDHSGQALAEGYLGAALLGDQFAVWFHWPRVTEETTARIAPATNADI